MKTNFKLKTQLIAFAYVLLVAVFVVGCTYKHDGEVVKATNGKLYKLKGNGRTSEAYHLIEIDTVDYNAKFK